jgi:transcriptional regulator with XRE-family HTH domain
VKTQLTEYGKIVRKLRIEAGISIADFAQAIGVSRPHVTATERGLCCPSIGMVDRVVVLFTELNIDASGVVDTVELPPNGFRINHECHADRLLTAALLRRIPSMTACEKQAMTATLDKR